MRESGLWDQWRAQQHAYFLQRLRDTPEGDGNMLDHTSVLWVVELLNPRPTHLIVNGDCAHSDGKEAEYKEFLRLVEPIRAAGITVHVTIGNHDNRKNLWKVLPFLGRGYENWSA